MEEIVDRTNHVGRKLIAVKPILLIGGIVAQVILLVSAIVLYVPLLIWPGILDGPYRAITKGMARMMAHTIVGKRANGQRAGKVTEKQIQLSSRYLTRRTRCLPCGVSHATMELSALHRRHNGPLPTHH